MMDLASPGWKYSQGEESREKVLPPCWLCQGNMSSNSASILYILIESQSYKFLYLGKPTLQLKTIFVVFSAAGSTTLQVHEEGEQDQDEPAVPVSPL